MCIRDRYNLACWYIDGVDIDLDEEEDEKEEQAFIWFEKSAEQGFIKSKFCLALCYEPVSYTHLDVYKRQVEEVDVDVRELYLHHIYILN